MDQLPSHDLDARGLDPRGRAFDAAVVALALMPLAYIYMFVFGFLTSGWAWVFTAALLAPIVLFEPLDPRAVRQLLLYLLFAFYSILTLLWTPVFVEAVITIAQLLVVALAYLVAWRIRDKRRFIAALPTVALYGIGAAALLALVTFGGRRVVGGIEMSVRPTAMGLVMLFILFGLGTRSWRRVTLVGALTFGVIMFTESRTAGAVLILVLLTHPSLMSNRPKWLTFVSLSLLAVLALSTTDAFKERFFFDDDATLRDVVTLSEQLNTAGRRELWPPLLRACSASPIAGNGVGIGSDLSEQLTGEILSHPHNEFIRVYCDTGLIGTALFWGFFVMAGVRNYQALRTLHAASAPARGRSTVRAADPDTTNLHMAALQSIGALLALSLTDNPLVYTTLYMVPIAIVLGLADAAITARARAGRPPISVGGGVRS